MLTSTLTIKTTMNDLKLLDELVDDVSTAEKWSDRLSNQIRLVLEELVVNVIHYGHDDQDDVLHDIVITITSSDDKVVAEVVDTGKPFDPLAQAPTPNTSAAIEDRIIGGLGIHLMFKLTDEVAYCREDGFNKLTLTKHRKAE